MCLKRDRQDEDAEIVRTWQWLNGSGTFLKDLETFTNGSGERETRVGPPAPAADCRDASREMPRGRITRQRHHRTCGPGRARALERV